MCVLFSFSIPSSVLFCSRGVYKQKNFGVGAFVLCTWWDVYDCAVDVVVLCV